MTAARRAQMGRSTPEGKVKAKVKAILHVYGEHLYAHWPVQNGFGAPTLDCNGSIKSPYMEHGAPFSIETKAPGKKPTKRQILTMQEMHKAGIKIFLIDGETYGYEPLKRWLALQFKRKQ